MAPSSVSIIPTLLAIARAVFILSPVIITIFIPEFLQVLIAFGTDILGGSIIPINPINIILCSGSLVFSVL